MSEPDPVVFVVDDDPSVRDATRRLISSVGLAVVTFGTATEFMRAARPEAPGCLVLDVRLPDTSGLDLQREISESSHPIPIIIITGHADVPMSVQAMKAGAVEFLTKPYRDQELLDAIQHAIEADRVDRRQRAELLDLRQRFESLTGARARSVDARRAWSAQQGDRHRAAHQRDHREGPAKSRHEEDAGHFPAGSCADRSTPRDFRHPRIAHRYRRTSRHASLTGIG